MCLRFSLNQPFCVIILGILWLSTLTGASKEPDALFKDKAEAEDQVDDDDHGNNNIYNDNYQLNGEWGEVWYWYYYLNTFRGLGISCRRDVLGRS